MIIVSGTVEIAAEDYERAVAAAIQMARASRQEEGCISYGFFANLEQPGVLRAFEEWRDEEALRFHFATEHMRDFRATLRSVRILAIAIKRYEVSSEGELSVPAQ